MLHASSVRKRCERGAHLPRGTKRWQGLKSFQLRLLRACWSHRGCALSIVLARHQAFFAGHRCGRLERLVAGEGARKNPRNQSKCAWAWSTGFALRRPPRVPHALIWAPRAPPPPPRAPIRTASGEKDGYRAGSMTGVAQNSLHRPAADAAPCLPTPCIGRWRARKPQSSAKTMNRPLGTTLTRS